MNELEADTDLKWYRWGNFGHDGFWNCSVEVINKPEHSDINTDAVHSSTKLWPTAGYHAFHFLHTASIEQVLGVWISLHIYIKLTQGPHKWDCLWQRWLAGDCSGKGSHWGTNVQWGPEGPVGEGCLASKWPPVVTLSQGWQGALSWG